MSQQEIASAQPIAGMHRALDDPVLGVEDRTRVRNLLDERLRFESLLSRLSATFINLPADEVDSQIERGLQQIVEFLGIERSSLAQFSEDGSELVVTHSYTIPGFAPFPRLNLAAIWPWYTAQIRAGQVLRFRRLPDDLPAEAAPEREWVLRGGLPRSHLAIPFKVGDAVLGGIGFGAYVKERDWPDEVVDSLRLVGAIFANALARKRADIVLRESEGRFRLMADTAPVMVWMSGPDKLCTYFNKHWLDFTGRPLEREIGAGWSEGVHADDLQRCLDTYIRAFDARQEFRMEYRLRRFDGQFRWILDAGVPRFETDGTFEGYIGSCIDITDHKRAEEALRDSEAGLRFLLESTHAIPWVADAQTWRFTYVGPQAGALLGYPHEAWFEPDFWVTHIHADDRQAALAFCLEHSRKHADYEFEYRMVAADSRTVWIHDIVHVVAENGRPVLLRGFMVDVTARRQAEEESRSLREQLIRVGRVSLMGELAASIAHEVNQPLCAIVSNAQALQRVLGGGGYDLDDLRETLDDIIRDGHRASAVIARIRGFFQKVPVEDTPVEVNDLVREVAALMRSEMARRGVAVKLELAQSLPPALGRRIQLQQVILNLMVNGADAMEGVARDLRELVIGSLEDAAGAIVLTVKDVGAGIEPENFDHVFDPFFTTKPAGMGMGLAICKSIVEAHGGRIWATSKPGQGATFQFTLPAIRTPFKEEWRWQTGRAAHD
jgi:two-component system, LuxR family, sensor kinase FixL